MISNGEKVKFSCNYPFVFYPYRGAGTATPLGRGSESEALFPGSDAFCAG
jgi:hypothetical protein